jgi:hypothetical protein
MVQNRSERYAKPVSHSQALRGNILNAKALVTSGSKEISIPNRDSISPTAEG